MTISNQIQLTDDVPFMLLPPSAERSEATESQQGLQESSTRDELRDESLLDQLERRQNDALKQLDALDAQITQIMRDWQLQRTDG